MSTVGGRSSRIVKKFTVTSPIGTNSGRDQVYFDSVKGASLPSELCEEAMQLEIKYMKEMNVYTSTGNISSCFFFYSGGVNFLMQLQFLAPVELFLKQLKGYSF